MPEEWCKVKYNDVNHAMRNCIDLLRSVEDKVKVKVIYFAKTDARSVFRLVPLLPGQYRWLVMRADHPITSKTYFFIDKCLPFGVSRSCAIFQDFSDALAHILKSWVKQNNCLSNYLDDFLFLALTQLWCDHLVESFLKLCAMVGCPVAEEKTEWGMTLIVFLGILFDGKRWVLAVPLDKRRKAIQLIQNTLSKKTITIKDLQKLAGSLNFLCKAIVPGRTFLRCLYDRMKSKNGELLRHHYHIRVDSQIKADCEMWLTFLQDEQYCVCRPFIDLDRFQTSETLDFYTDSSANHLLGFGCVYGKWWMFGQWEPGFIKLHDPSIEYLELAALGIAVITWGNLLRDTRIVIFCDNQAMVHMINNATSKCQNCMVIIRKIVLDNMRNNRRVFIKYVTSKSNECADSLS